MALASSDRPQDNAIAKAWMVLILLVAALLRLHGLAEESIWLDEATSILLAQERLPDLIRATAQDIHPPGYYALLHLWLGLGPGAWIARSLSAFLGIISVAAIYQLGKSALGQGAGLATALLLAVSPLHIWYAQETRMYALVTLLALLGSYALWRAIVGSRPAVAWAGYAVCMAIGKRNAFMARI